MAPKTVDTWLDEAIETLAHGLEQRGMRSEDAREVANEHRGSILVSEDGVIRVQHRGGFLYSGTHADPLGAFASYLYAGAPAAKKLGSTLTDEERAQLKQNVRSRGVY